MGLTPDPKKLTPEQRDQLEAYQSTKKQLQLLEDIADISQEMLNVLDAQDKTNEKVSNGTGALLVDMREALNALKDRKDPETPDYAKPVVEAVKQLEKSLQSLDLKPNITVDTPQVNVSPPSVDLRGVEKAVAAIPKAFAEAIKLMPKLEIPETDNQPLLDAWEGISEQLVSIETATRMKPQPGSMTISNLADITTQIDALTDAELRASPVPVEATIDTTGLATEDKQDVLYDLVDELSSIASSLAFLRQVQGIASDLRVTLLGGTTAVTGTLTTVTTVTTTGTLTNQTNIGGFAATNTIMNQMNTNANQLRDRITVS